MAVQNWTPEQEAAARARNEALNARLTAASGFGEGGANRAALENNNFARNLGADVAFKKPDGTAVLNQPASSVLGLGHAQIITNFSEPRATDALQNGNSTVIPNNKTTAAYSIKRLDSVVENPMEQFASSAVLWTLACLTPSQLNNPLSYRSSPQALQNIVFSSGGRFDSQRVNTFFGTPEYYINNFQMNCVIGANEKTGNSNAIKFTFDIHEPHSMGLLLQSMQNAAIKSGYLNYLDNTPYVLRMDIIGYDELGQIIKSIKPKFFVLRLNSVKFAVNESGSTYAVEATPWNHQAFSSIVNVTYNDLKISGDLTGKGNVVEVLQSSKDSLTSVLNRNEKKLVKEERIKEPDVYVIQFPKTASEWYSSAGSPPADKKATVNPEIADRISISGGSADADQAELPVNEIGEASLGFNQQRGGNILFKRAGDQYDSASGVVKRDGMTIDPKARAFQFGQGQSLTSIINQIVLSSDYAKKAILSKEKGGFGTTPEGYYKWFKIDAQVELLNLDPLIGDYAKKVTYRVVPYYVHQSIYSNVNSAPVGYSELMKKIVKEYQYIYTGQNVDVLKFDININNLFFTGGNPVSENLAAKTSNQDQKLSEQLNKTAKTGQGSAPASQAAHAGRARTKRDPRLLAGYKGGNPDKTTEQNIAEHFQQAFISGGSADLVSLDLEIMGDPYWLVDSGIGNYFADAPSETSQITNDGTMNYEAGNVYIYLSFRTPADINETSGLYDFSVAGKESPFGGIYRVNMVENYFVDGMWKQKLKCVRMPGPQGPEANKKIDGETTLAVSQSNNNVTELGDEETPRQSVIADSSTNSSTQAPGDNAASTGNSNPSTSAKKAKTITTSNTAERRVGFRYYRDLGQN